MPRASSREQILERAVQLASVHGLEGLSIGALAQDIGMSKGGICAHFHAKLELQLATVERAAQVMQNVVVVPSLKAAPGKARLEALDAAWFNYLDQRIFLGGCFFTNAVLELDGLELPEVRQAVIAQYNRLLDFVEKNAHEAIEKNEFRSDLETNRFALEWIGVKLGAILWRGLARENNPAREASSALLRRVSNRKLSK
jgi:AcrR family transcriptional regulator